MREGMGNYQDIPKRNSFTLPHNDLAIRLKLFRINLNKQLTDSQSSCILFRQ